MVENSSLLQLFAKRMTWLSNRQALITSNIANADTPNYVPKDLPADGFRKLLLSQSSPRLETSLTREGHIRPTGAGGTTLPAVDAPDIYEATPSGNAVVVEEQMVKMNLINTNYGMVVGLYKKHLTMMKLAIKGSSG